MIVFGVIALVVLAYGVVHLVNRRHNRAAQVDDFLHNQGDAAARQFRYGFFPSSHNGCGWIAAYNACRILGDHVQPAEIISDFERYGAILFGAFGTIPAALTHFFRKRGYRADSSGKRERFDEMAKKATVSVLWYWHGKGAHFIAVAPGEDGFVGYNVFSDTKRPIRLGASVQEFLKARNYHAPRLIAVKKELPNDDERATA
ncbi:MAG: hypothetical protein IJJ99_00410 [Oscillospiraceae bacterium]|nr:hypothetical protein [Oscillospiraceae bacterium]